MAIRRKAERRSTGTADPAPAVDKRIEHEAKKLARELECTLLRAGRSFARQLRERARQVAARQREHVDEVGRQRAAVVEEVVERSGDVLLVLIEPAAGPTQHGRQIQNHVGRRVAQVRTEVRRDDAKPAEFGIAKPPARMQDRIASRGVASGGEHRLHARAGQRRSAADIGARGSGPAHLHQVDRPGLEREIAGDGHRAGRRRQAGSKRAAAVHGDIAHGADAAQRAAGDRHGVVDRAVDQERAALHSPRPRTRRSVHGPGRVANFIVGGEAGILRSDQRKIERPRS